VAGCRRSVAVEETEGEEDPLKWGELGLGLVLPRSDRLKAVERAVRPRWLRGRIGVGGAATGVAGGC